MDIFYLPIIYGVLINVLGVYVMYSDKRNAMRHTWRTKEKDIFQLAILGGALGILIGMHKYRHKTKHKSFTIGIPIILIVNIACYGAALYFLTK